MKNECRCLQRISAAIGLMNNSPQQEVVVRWWGAIRPLLDEDCGADYRLAKERLLNVARGCHDYGGGYRDAHEAEIFHHGIATVVNALEAFVKAPELQVRVLESIGARSVDATNNNK